MFWYDPTFMLLIPVILLAFYAQSKVQSNYNRYKQVPGSNGLTGKEVAEYILRKNGLYDVPVTPVKGQLTDHYDPRTREVHLSEDIFYGRSISSTSIAAHEVGHALQHAHSYVPLSVRAGIFPIARLGSGMAFPLFIIGMLLRTSVLMDLGIWFFAGALVFHIVTLPVEFNASHRALAQLSDGLMADPQELAGARKVLGAAALTYVASTLMALVQFLRLIILRGSRD